MVDWNVVRKEYETTDISLNELAAKYDIKYPTIKSRRKRQKWAKDASKKVASKKKKDATKPNSKKAIIQYRKPDDELTEKQRLFCQCYIVNFNATQAAIKAGYSKESAGVIGYENLTKPYVRAEVERLKEIKRQSIMLTEDDIVERYIRIAFSDMTDIAEFGTEFIPDIDLAGNMQIDKNGNVKCIQRNYLYFKNSEQVDGALIKEVKLGRQGMSVKLEDKQKALDWLSNYFNMNPMNRHKMAYANAVLAIRKKELELKDW